MGENSTISWTDHTMNPWIGCTRVGPGCDHCYAARDNQRRKWVESWGEIGSTGSPRRRTKTWGHPITWNNKAKITGYRPRVFCASLADVFDNEVPDEWRTDLWELIRKTPLLRWMLLTKRIGNAKKMLPADWPDAFPHVGLMVTAVNQEEWDRDIPKLMAMPAAWHGVSVEPMIGPVVLNGWHPNWVITGGESGPGSRLCEYDWVRSMRDQCAEAGIAFHHKQWSSVVPKVNGCRIDGREHKDFPSALAA